MRHWLGVSVCLLAVGCINTSVQRLDQAARPERPPEAVAVLLERPSQPFTIIAFVESKGQTAFDSFADLRARLVAEAAKLGGDAVILGPESTDSEFIFTGSAMIKSDRKRLVGEIIVYDRGDRS